LSAGFWCFRKRSASTPTFATVTERFAANGFLTIAPELYHRTGPGFESGYTDFAVVVEVLIAPLAEIVRLRNPIDEPFSTAVSLDMSLEDVT